MPARVLVPDLDAATLVASLPEDETHHLVRVLRLGAGDTVRVFDGRGREWDAVVEAVAGRHARVRLGAPAVPAPEPRVRVTLAMALVKGDKMDDVVRDAVMLGVTTIRPVVTAHGQVPRAGVRAPGLTSRWQRVAVASTKQSGRAVVPHVAEVAPVTSLWDEGSGLRLLLAEPALADEAVVTPASLAGEPPPEVTLAVGPEGGWHPGEVAAAKAAGWRLLRLGGRTLRADAAPIVALSALLAVWGEL
ncbi:MAG: RsmE family RNA methyltransferase [Vicinamibacteria bacterium]